LRFCPLQRSPARDALYGAAALRTIPLRRFLFATRPARPRNLRAATSPMRFYALRIRCGGARCTDLPPAVSHQVFAPRGCGGSLSAGNVGIVFRSSLLRAARGIRVRPRSETTRHIKRLRFAYSPGRTGHASPFSLAAMFRYRSDPSRPGRTSRSFPRSRSAALMGFLVCALRRFAPATGGGSFLIEPGPHACSSDSHAPINFRRVDRRLR